MTSEQIDLKRRRAALACAASAAVLAAPVRVRAEEPKYPGRPVALVVPYGPGGVVDITGRALAEGLSAFWKQSVIVDNKAGAAGLIGANFVARSDATGYRLLFTDDGVMVSMPHVQTSMPYNALTDLTPLSMTGTYPYIVFANTRAGINSLDDLVVAAKARPSTITFATNGIGSTQHLAWERFQRAAGIRLSHVPYKSSLQALQDVIGGHVALMTTAITTALPFLSDPSLVALASTAPTRSSLLPNVSTVAELGYPNFAALGWLGLFAPSTTSPQLVRRLSHDVAAVVASQPYVEALGRLGVRPLSTSSQELAARLRREYEQTGAEVVALGLGSSK